MKIKNFELKIRTTILLSISFLLIFALPASAHETGQPHAETPASIDSVVAVIVIVVIALGGFLLWRFVLKSPQPPVQTLQKKTETPPPSNPPVNGVSEDKT